MKVPFIFAAVLSRRSHVGPPGTMVQDGNTSVENGNESVISTEGTVKLGIPSRKSIVREHVSSSATPQRRSSKSSDAEQNSLTDGEALAPPGWHGFIEARGRVSDLAARKHEDRKDPKDAKGDDTSDAAETSEGVEGTNETKDTSDTNKTADNSDANNATKDTTSDTNKTKDTSDTNTTKESDESPEDHGPDLSAKAEQLKEKGAKPVEEEVDPRETDVKEEVPPGVEEAAKKAREENELLATSNPLLVTHWEYIILPFVALAAAGGFYYMVFMFTEISEQDTELIEYELPECMTAVVYMSAVIGIWRLERHGWDKFVIVEALSGSVSYFFFLGFSYLMLFVNDQHFAAMNQDVAERNMLFEAFDDPENWQARNWNQYPNTVWERVKLSTYCHDVIFGKAKHVNSLSPSFYFYGHCFLFLWCLYMFSVFKDHFRMLESAVLKLEKVTTKKTITLEDDDGGGATATAATAPAPQVKKRGSAVSFEQSGTAPDVDATEDTPGATAAVPGGQSGTAPDVDTKPDITAEYHGDINIVGWSQEYGIAIALCIFAPRIYLDLCIFYQGCEVLLVNKLDDDIQDFMMKSIELLFILELDQLLYTAVVSDLNKRRLSKLKLPSWNLKGAQVLFFRYYELLLTTAAVLSVFFLLLWFRVQHETAGVISVREEGIIEGCCNFFQYLKGEGRKAVLSETNPCEVFRQTYEQPFGIDATGGLLPPGDKPVNGVTVASSLQ